MGKKKSKEEIRGLMILAISALMLFTLVSCSSSDDDDDKKADESQLSGLPVIMPTLDEVPWTQTQISFEQLHNIKAEEGNLTIDLGQPDIWGQIYIGPYPFEPQNSDFDYVRYVKSAKIAEGKAVIPLSGVYVPKYDANGWIEGLNPGTPTVAYRLELFKGESSDVGLYGSLISFEGLEDGTFRKMPTIIDGPYITLLSSNDPGSMTIVWETDEACSGKVILGTSEYKEEAGQRAKHSVKLSGLTPATAYEYAVESSASDGRTVRSENYTVRTAPAKGQGSVVFAYSSDCRTGKVGGGEWEYMGVNLHVLNQTVTGAYHEGAQFIVFPGDLVYGYSTDTKDFALQLKGWKQGMSPFWRTRPVYTGMGNHEICMNMYGDDGNLVLDKWPYATDSSEAVFASELFNPTNGPEVSDSRRPSYKENAYSFQYGTVAVIVFNNTYLTTGFDVSSVGTYGGCPLGYIMEDQLAWIEAEIKKAEADSTVKYIFLATHSPIFPKKYVHGGTWYGGDNNVRAYTRKSAADKVEPEAYGIIEMRNRLWKAAAQSSKVAAVFSGDEHAYHRILIGSDTPVGVYPADDTDGDGVLDKYSPNPEFTHPVWHITSGGGGSPYIADFGETPWEAQRMTSAPGYVLIRAEGGKVSMEYVSNSALGTGEVLDEVEDLMAVKKMRNEK